MPALRSTDARRRVLALAEEAPAWTRSGLAHAAGVTPSVIDGLTTAGAFEPVKLPPLPVVPEPDTSYARAELSPQQREAAERLVEAVEADAFSATLLEGVTGSGKTEAYLEAAARALRAAARSSAPVPRRARSHSWTGGAALHPLRQARRARPARAAFRAPARSRVAGSG